MHKALVMPFALENGTTRFWKSSPAPHARKQPGDPALVGAQVPTVFDPPEWQPAPSRLSGPTHGGGSFLPTSYPTGKESQNRSQSPPPKTGWVGMATGLAPPRATSEPMALIYRSKSSHLTAHITEHTSELHVCQMKYVISAATTL